MSETCDPLVLGRNPGSPSISTTRIRVVAGIVLAVLVRLILMPISLHGDVFYIHSMPPVIFSEGVWNIYKYFESYGVRHGFIHYAPLVGYITAFSEFIASLISSSFHGFIVELPKLTLDEGGVSSVVFFMQYPLANRLLFAFLMKWPYFFFDLACGFMIYFAYREEKGLAWFSLLSSWMFHPVLLYGVYVFGQHRIFSAMFVWLAILLLKKGRPAWACFAFGWILLLDNFGFIILLPFIISVSWNFKAIFKHSLIALIPFALVFFPLYIGSDGFAAYAYVAPQWVFQATQPIFRSIPFSALVLKGAFAAGFICVLIILIRYRSVPLTPDQKMKLNIYVCSVVLFLFYAATMVSVHYFLWILPFFLILNRESVPWPKYLNLVLIFLLFFFNLDSRGQNLGLFSPVNPAASSWPSLHEIMASWTPWGKIIGLSRMAFTVLCLFMAWRLFGQRIKPLLQNARAQVITEQSSKE